MPLLTNKKKHVVISLVVGAGGFFAISDQISPIFDTGNDFILEKQKYLGLL